MEEKVIKFDLSADTLLDIAEKKLDEKDYIGALRVLRKSVEKNGATADEYSMFADIYDEMELYECAVNYWYKFLDVCAEEEVADAYEGLAACYYNLGSDMQAAFYYNLMMHDKYVSPENGIELGEMFAEPAKRRFRIVYPPEEADYSEELEGGLRALRGGDYKKADEVFSSVPEGAPCYGQAQNFLALSKLMQGDAAAAEEICLERLVQNEEDIPVLTTYAAVLTEQGRPQESRRVAERLAALPAENADELYKIATVCCENKLYDEAYEKFCTLEKQVHYDLTLLYFKAVAAFKSGRVQESLAAFAKLIDIYPNAAVARYYFGEIRRYAEEGGAEPETSFFYRVPKKERETRVKILASLAEMPRAALDAFLEKVDITDHLEWCFDEADGADAELMLLGMRLAVREGMDAFVRDLLLDSTLNDVIKIEGLRYLAERNKDFEAGVVVADIYRCATFVKLDVGRTKRSRFIAAYALAFARFCFLADEDCESFRSAAERIYAALEREDKLSLASDAESLACAIFFVASENALKRAKEALGAAGGDSMAVAEILRAVNADAEKEIAATRADSPQAEESDGKSEEE